MSTQTLTIEITAKVEMTFVSNKNNEQVGYKTPERKIVETIIVPDAPSKRRRVKYPFDILTSDLE